MINRKNACFIPIKSKSIRVPGKNFKLLNNKRLFEYIVDAAIASNVFDDIFVDTDSKEVKKYCINKDLNVIDRDPCLAQDSANGNDLLNAWYNAFSHYEYYFQLFATSPFTSVKTIKECVEFINNNDGFDSIFTAYEECGWYWFENTPINYDPQVLPRSQDAKKVFSETTALYGITSSALKINKCRIGVKPYFYFVNDVEAVDIDSEFDFQLAETIAKEHYTKT